jgi:hypothetical protein
MWVVATNEGKPLVKCDGRPLTLGELIQLIDGSRHREEEQPGGPLVCHWENMVEWGESIDDAVGFAWI